MYSRDKIIKTLREVAEESVVVKPYIIIAQPRRSEAETPAQIFDAAKGGAHLDMAGYSYRHIDIFGEKVDVARNYLMDVALESGAKYMLFIGEDTVLPWYGFSKLHETAEKNPGSIVCGVYYFKFSNPMIIVREENGHVRPANVDPGQVFETWQTGMDCMLIPIEVLKKLKDEDPELPFCCIGYGIEDLPFIGEDNFFTYRTRKNGIKTLVDTDVQCLHMDLATGKYTAHPKVNLDDYITAIEVTEPLQIKDRKFIDKRWVDRLPEGSNGIRTLVKQREKAKLYFNISHQKKEDHISIDIFDEKIDFENLKVDDQTVDEVFMSHALNYIPLNKAQSAINEIKRVLKPNGKIIFEQIDFEKFCSEFLNSRQEDKNFLSMCLFNNFSTSKENKVQHAYYPDRLKQMLKEADFRNIEEKECEDFYLPGPSFRIEATK